MKPSLHELICDYLYETKYDDEWYCEECYNKQMRIIGGKRYENK